MDDLYTIRDTKSYKRFAILQKLNELKKKLKRNWDQETQDRIEALQRDLND